MDFTPYIQEGQSFSISIEKATFTLKDGSQHECHVEILSINGDVFQNGGRVISLVGEVIELPTLQFDPPSQSCAPCDPS